MRKKLLIAGATGALTLAGLGVALPALADDGTGSTAGSTSEDRIRNALSDLVADGSITEEQADEVATTLGDAGLGDHGGPGGHGPGGRLGLSTAAEALGMTEDELRTALEADGASLATVAQAQGVDVQTLVDALVAARTEHLDQAVADGELTQEEADERLADLEARITERVNSTDVSHGPRGGGHGRGGEDDED